MPNASISVLPSVNPVDTVASQLLNTAASEDGAGRIQAALDTFFSCEDNASQPLEAARQLVGHLSAHPAERLMLVDPAVGLLRENLANRVPCFKSALQWPQVGSFDDRLIRHATDLLDVDSLAENQDDPDDPEKTIYKRALQLLPSELLRLNAGLTVAKDISSAACDLYVNSKFCVLAEDKIENFALFTSFLLPHYHELLPPLSDSQHQHAQRTELLLKALYPSFDDKENKPLDGFGTAIWKQATAHQFCKNFSEPVVTEAENMFATDAGQELRFKFPQIMCTLDTLARSSDFASLAEKCVNVAIAERHQFFASVDLQAA